MLNCSLWDSTTMLLHLLTQLVCQWCLLANAFTTFTLSCKTQYLTCYITMLYFPWFQATYQASLRFCQQANLTIKTQYLSTACTKPSACTRGMITEHKEQGFNVGCSAGVAARALHAFESLRSKVSLTCPNTSVWMQKK